MSDCSKHKKEVAGISDMKELAEMIGDLHYESLSQFLWQLEKKLFCDAEKDESGNRDALATQLKYAAAGIRIAYHGLCAAWRISKPFMQNKQLKP